MLRIFIVFSFSVLMSSCAHDLLVKAQRDVTYNLDKGTPLYLALGNDVSVSEKNLYNHLGDALKEAGFNLKDQIEQAQVVMTFASMHDKNVQYRFDPWPTYFGPSYWYPYWPRSYPRTYVTDERSIELRLFQADSFRAGNRVPLWEGVISGSPETFGSRLRESLRILVDKVGQDYRGHVRVPSPNQ